MSEYRTLKDVKILMALYESSNNIDRLLTKKEKKYCTEGVLSTSIIMRLKKDFNLDYFFKDKNRNRLVFKFNSYVLANCFYKIIYHHFEKSRLYKKNKITVIRVWGLIYEVYIDLK